MLVWPPKKALILKLRDPERVTNFIPTAKTFTADGSVYVAVPHRNDEVRVLRNLGFDAPAPITHLYNWPGRFVPFAAQKSAAAFLSLNDRAFNLSELGTGKSLAALWAYDYRRSVGLSRRLLVISPLSTLERTWADELFGNFPHLKYAVLHGDKAKRLRLLNDPYDVYIVNHDGVGIIKDALANRTDIDTIIIDEIAQAARNVSTARWKVFNEVVNKQCGRRTTWGLTATPTPTEPLDAWAQCRLLVPENVSPYKTRFRDMLMIQRSMYKWEPRPESTAIIHKVMQPSIRFTRDECVDLPPLMYETRHVAMTAEQNRVFKALRKDLYAQLAAGEITAINAAAKQGKLIQVASGAVFGADGNILRVDASSRVAEAISIVQQAEGKVIVYAPYRAAVELLTLELGKHFTVGTIHGGVSASERGRIFGDFQRAAAPQVIVAQPAAMAHGLTLTAASTILWFAPPTSNEIFEQANGRINRPGQTMHNYIVMLEGSPEERRVYQNLVAQQRVQDAFLAAVKAGREDLAA